MPNAFLQTRRHTGRIVMTAVVLTVLLMGVIAVVTVLTHTRPAAAVTAISRSNPAPSSTSTASEPAAAPMGVKLRLVRGRSVINGLSVQYPHTRVGAVSAAVEYVTAMATLDPDREAAVGRLIADDSWALAPQEFAASAIGSRRAAGLSGTEAVPPGASIQVTPIQYQVRNATPDNVTVLLLGYFVTTTPQAGTVSRTILMPVRMHWNGLDWKMLRPGDRDPQYGELMVSLGTAKAATLGWLDMGR